MTKPNSNNGKYRAVIKPGCIVDIIQKYDQNSGEKTRGVVKVILTNSQTHPHGIKVRLIDGRVGRVIEIIKPDVT